MVATNLWTELFFPVKVALSSERTIVLCFFYLAAYGAAVSTYGIVRLRNNLFALSVQSK